MDTAVLLNQMRANVCEHTTKMASLGFLKGATRGLQKEWMEGNLKDYLRLIPLDTAPFKNSGDAILVMCLHTFALF